MKVKFLSFEIFAAVYVMILNIAFGDFDYAHYQDNLFGRIGWSALSGYLTESKFRGFNS